MSSLIKNTLVRTLEGLKPLSALKVGDKVIACTGSDIDVDTITQITARKVEKNAQELRFKGDSVIIGMTHSFDSTPAANLKIGHKVKILDSNLKLAASELSATKKVAYDDITFSVSTAKYHNMFVGSVGSILIECD